MNTNSKHYETLNIQPWEIMEANFSKEEFIAYLKGNIIKYTLHSKGQDLSDAQKIKHYAEKLIEVLENKWEPIFKVGDRVRVKGYNYHFKYDNTKEATVIKVGIPYQEKSYLLKLDDENKGWNATLKKDGVECSNTWCVYETEIEMLEKPEVKHKFKVGDRVRAVRYGETGTIIRTPVEGLKEVDEQCYIIEFDAPYTGWKATKEKHLVESERAWYVNDNDIELLQKEPKKTLEPNKWYDASLYTIEELKELLPVGTQVIVTAIHDNDRKVNLEKEIVKEDVVEAVTDRPLTHDTRIGLSNDCWFRRYFKIIE